MNKRAYSMTTRAASSEQTRVGILRATLSLLGEKSTLEIVLADVAERSGVTVKTVLRHFGSREGLFDAVSAFAQSEIEEERRAPVGDVAAAVSAIVAHYELRGDWVIRLLGEEHADHRIAAVVAEGRRVHQTWVRTVFAPHLDAAGALRDATADLLVVATDVYTWKILRRDQGHSRAATEARMRALARTVLSLENIEEGSTP